MSEREAEEMNTKRIELLKDLNKAIEDHNRAYASGNSPLVRLFNARIDRISAKLDKA